MKKIGLVCMLVTSFYAYSTQARVCLLGDPTCNSGISVETAQKCDDYVSRNPKWVKENNLCEAMDYSLACEDYKDRYYIEAGCASGYVNVDTLTEGYICKDTKCNGKCCLQKEIKCADEYKECNALTEGAGDKCVESNTQYFEISANKYTECLCNTRTYKYNNSNCKDFFEPTGEKCSGDNGAWWKECKSRFTSCKDWNSSSYTQAQVGYNCTATEIPLKNGSKTTCYTNCKVDCEYDGNYYTQEACVGAMDHSVCGADKDGCWYFANCETGYKYENDKCVADCQYADKAACEKANPNKNCKPDKYGCSVPADCKIGYEDNGFGNCEIVLCPLGSSTNYNTVANCGYPSTIGASVTSTGQYSGSKLCYKCNCSVPSECKWTDANKGDKGTLKDVCCNGTTYKTCTKNFPTDVTVPSNASAIKTSYTACGETKQIVTDWTCNLGYIENSAGTGCDVAQCPRDSKTEYSDVSKCGYPSTIGASVTSTGQYSGSKLCYKCNCSVPSECKWTDANKGDKGALTNVCCDGTTYKTCTKNFPADVTVPSNATATKTSYTACGETKQIVTDWTCNKGYVENSAGTGCDVAQCPTGSKTEYSDVSKCGYPSTIGASVTSTGQYSGSKLCYTCNCSITSECKWTDENKGDKGTIKDVCCDGKTYKTCTQNFPSAVSVPDNATATKTSYTACGVTKQIATDWTCNKGYVKSGNSCIDECKDYTLSSCTTGANCSSCSNGKYKITSCKSGYTATKDSSGKIIMCITTPSSSSSSGGSIGCTNCCSRGFRYCCSGTCTNTKPYSSNQLPNGISTFETCIDYGSYCSNSSSSSSGGFTSGGGNTSCCSKGYKYDCSNLGGTCSNTTSQIGTALCLACNSNTTNLTVNTNSSGTLNNGLGTTTNNSLLGNTTSGRFF